MKEDERLPLVPSPFSLSLWTGSGRLADLPYLEQGKAFIWFSLGFGVVAAVAAAQGMPRLSVELALCYLLLSVATAMIGYKQYSYYYRDKHGSRKDGIFVRSVRQASSAEETLDFLLAIAGGSLVGALIVPAWWLFVASIYSGIVALRCYVTMNRDRYWINGGRVKALVFIPNSLCLSHNGLVVGEVMGGWVFSHSILLVLGVFCWYRTKGYAGSPLYDAIVIIYFVFYYAGLRSLSLWVGRRLWARHHEKFSLA